MTSVSIHWGALSPILVLLGAGLGSITMGSLFHKFKAHLVGPVATFIGGLGGLLASCILWVRVDNEGGINTIADSVRVDQAGLFITAVISVAVLFSAFPIKNYLEREKLHTGVEAYSLVLFSAVGGAVMAVSNDLIVLFMGLEALSIAAYVLAAMHIRRAKSQESGMKYFVMGAFSSAFFLYGIALIYGATGSTKLGQIAERLGSDAPLDDGLFLAGLGLFLVGLLFKVSAVPFHTWTPDVYEGAPSPFVAFMSSAVKAAGFVALIRVLGGAFITRADDWQPVIYVVAIATIAVGALAALVQTNVKRMLAYSSISHAGYILVGIQAGTQDGFAASLWYIAAYSILALGSFIVVSVCGGIFSGQKSSEMDTHNIENYKGLSARRPFLAVVFAVFLIAQAGVPPTSGFYAKFSVISAVIDERTYPLAVVAMVLAVVAAFIYIRLLVMMFFFPPPDSESGSSSASPSSSSQSQGTKTGYDTKVSKSQKAQNRLLLTVAALFTIAMGVYPGPLQDLALAAARAFV